MNEAAARPGDRGERGPHRLRRLERRRKDFRARTHALSICRRHGRSRIRGRARPLFRHRRARNESESRRNHHARRVPGQSERARRKAKPGKWITGRGWIETFWKPPLFPTREDLDKIAPNNPVYLTRADGHASVANSAALKIAGVTKNTKAPFGGQILKDKQTGEPTGMLIDTAQNFGQAHSTAGRGNGEEAIVLANKRRIELGWCQIQNAGGSYREVAPSKNFRRRQGEDARLQCGARTERRRTRLLREGPTIGAFDHRYTLRTIKVVSMARWVRAAPRCSNLTRRSRQHRVPARERGRIAADLEEALRAAFRSRRTPSATARTV